MIPSGDIFASVRGDMLDVLPEHTSAYARLSTPLAEWMHRGSYTVVGTGRKCFRLAAAPVDIGSSVLLDVEHLTNHACEHLLELYAFSSGDRPRSEAWNVTTVYYLGFFAAQALLRLVGRPVVFLDSSVVGQIKKLGGNGPAPGAGTFCLVKRTAVSPMSCELEWRRLDQRVHDATWLHVMKYLKEKLALHTGCERDEEFVFYTCLTGTWLFGEYGGHQWPSELRNRVNYRPGFAYRLFCDGQVCGMRKSVNRLTRTKTADRLALLDSVVNSVSSDPKDLPKQCDVLLHTSMSLFCLMRQCYEELAERRRIDRRWEDRRRSTIRGMAEGKRVAELGCMFHGK